MQIVALLLCVGKAKSASIEQNKSASATIWGYTLLIKSNGSRELSFQLLNLRKDILCRFEILVVGTKSHHTTNNASDGCAGR